MRNFAAVSSLSAIQETSFCSADGKLHLHLEPYQASEPEAGEVPAQADLTALRLKNFISRLKYQDPNSEDNLTELARLIGDFQDYVKPVVPTNQSDMLMHHKSVRISGEGLELCDDTFWERSAFLTCNLCFLTYPYGDISVKVRVTSCVPIDSVSGDYAGMGEGAYSLKLAYEGIPEADRDLIIRFVNFLQRAQRQR